MIIKAIRRIWSRLTQRGTGGLIQPGDWRAVYPDGYMTRYMSYGDARLLRKAYGGQLQWRGDTDRAREGK